MKINYFKLGAVACILLGAMHLLSQLLRGNDLDPQLASTLAEMKATEIHVMGKHTLLQFYNGFSLTMGFLLVAFGLQAWMIDNPGKRVILTNVFASVIIFVLTLIYFHVLASAFMLIAAICFTMSFIKSSRQH